MSSSQTCDARRNKHASIHQKMSRLGTHISEVAIENLDIPVDDLQRNKLIVGVSDFGDEEQRGIASVDDLYLPSQALATIKSRQTNRSAYLLAYPPDHN